MKLSWISLAIASVFVVVVGCTPPAEPSGSTTGTDPAPPKSTDGSKMATVDFEKDVKPGLVSFCTPCHAGAEPQEGLDVTKLTGSEKASFAKMGKVVEAGEMPPEKSKQPTAEERAKLAEQLKALSG